MNHCSYPDCDQKPEVPVLYAPEIWACDEHYLILYKTYIKNKESKNVNLGQVVQYYKKRDGSRGRITHGKAWEIDNRTVSKQDGKTIINRRTGKEAQY